MDINSKTIEELLEEYGSNNEQDSAARAKPEVERPLPLQSSPQVKLTVAGVAATVAKEPVRPCEVIPRSEVTHAADLHNPFQPNRRVDHEKVEHRAILLLKCAGVTNRDIARELGYSEVHVGSVVNQPWAQQFMLGRLHGTSDKAMKALQDASEASALRLIQLAATAKNEETRRKANNDILDRKYGKPNQPYTHTEKPANELSDAELAKFVDTSN